MESDRIDDSIYNQQDVYNGDFARPPTPRQQYYQEMPLPAMQVPQPVQVQVPAKKSSIFDDIDKNTWILIFIAFILGFFMGKTMQPVILKNL